MKEKKQLFKHQVLITVISIVAVVIIAIGSSMAVFTKTANGTEYNVVQVGELELSYVDLNEEGNVLTLASSYPVADSVGEGATPYRFSVENTGTLVANYTVKIIDDTDTINADGCSDKLLDTSNLKYKFDNEENKTLTKENDGYVVHTGTLQPFESNIHELRIWINETSPNSVLGKHFHGKVVIEIVQGEGSNPYERPTSPDAVENKLFASENLGANCKTYNDGVDTFLVGQCQNNYVWYSGKLWRVVLKNNRTGNVKMVTDNAITAIPYNEFNNSTFENSYTDQWLQQEFLPTLHDADKFLVTNSSWDTTAEYSTRPNGTTTLTRTVGLLNAYEYNTTYKNSDGLATKSTTYLTNKKMWLTLTSPSNISIQYIGINGDPLSGTSNIGGGIRPSINIKSNVRISNGSGAQSNPYKLVGDIQKPINETTFLNTSYSGEYITFNNSLYRIVGVEENKTKITAVDPVEKFNGTPFGSSLNFGESTMKATLETYYQSLDTKWKNMIAENQKWYLDTVESGHSYKKGICDSSNIDSNISTKDCVKTSNTTTASIGLPRIGEVFTSQISRNQTCDLWTLTPYNQYNISRIAASEEPVGESSTSTVVNVRPSMYLKSNVVIASDNTGDGTYEHPYAIELPDE